MTGRAVRWLLASLLGLALLCGCGSTLPAGDAGAPYAARRLTWVSQQGGPATLHYGQDELDVPQAVEAVWPTAYGFLVRHRTGPDVYAPSQVVLVDDRGTEVVPGEVSDLHVSGDGRYAGWIDYEGPRRLGYRLAEAVVVDLATGEEVLRDHRDMGDWNDRDLYGDQYPTFLGFDDTHAYWETALAGDDGHRIRRVDLRTGEVAVGGEDGEYGEVAAGRLVDPDTGVQTAMAEDGTPSATGEGTSGFVSADGRWCFTSGRTGRLPVTDCDTGSRATPRYPAAPVRFAGWSEDPDAFYVLAARRGLDVVVPPDEPDPTRGVLARCELPAGACTVQERVRGVSSLVLPGTRP